METGETVVREFEELFGLITMTERKWLVDRITALSRPEPTEDVMQARGKRLADTAKLIINALNNAYVMAQTYPVPDNAAPALKDGIARRTAMIGSARHEANTTLEHDIAALRAMPPQDHGKMQSPKMRAETTPEMLTAARRFVLEKPSTSYLQRKLMIGYNHACEIMEHFEAEGLVSAWRADGKRVVLAEGQISGAKP